MDSVRTFHIIWSGKLNLAQETFCRLRPETEMVRSRFFERPYGDTIQVESGKIIVTSFRRKNRSIQISENKGAEFYAETLINIIIYIIEGFWENS